jgi:hypothetical protein
MHGAGFLSKAKSAALAQRLAKYYAKFSPRKQNSIRLYL